MYAEAMKKLAYVYWQHEGMWVGYLQEFPDYWTQGVSREELEEQLGDLWKDLNGDAIPEVRRMAKLHVS
jgi:predicted RNase H-like HicB family nuclease